MSNSHAYEYMLQTDKAGMDFAQPTDPNVTVGWTLYELSSMFEEYHRKTATPNSLPKDKDYLDTRLNAHFNAISKLLGVSRPVLPKKFKQKMVHAKPE